MSKKLNDAQSEINKNEKKLEDAKNEIKENEQKLTDGQAEYDAEYEENHQKIEDAKADIMQAKADLADIEVPEWYVLDRNYITTCVAYAQDSERNREYWKLFFRSYFSLWQHSSV